MKMARSLAVAKIIYARPMKNPKAIHGDNPASVQFLFTELQTGLTFADIALSAKPDDTEKIRTVSANARKSYETFAKFRERVASSEEEVRQLNAGLSKLKDALRNLGEAV